VVAEGGVLVPVTGNAPHVFGMGALTGINADVEYTISEY
jgi:hypothetical protein